MQDEEETVPEQKVELVFLTPEKIAVEQAIAESGMEEPDPSRDEDGIDYRVLAGARMLDARFPEWAKKINLETFRIEDGDRCVLGQTFGVYQRGLEILDIDDIDNERPYMYGFLGDDAGDSAGRGANWHTLQEDWVAVITARQETG